LATGILHNPSTTESNTLWQLKGEPDCI